MFIGYAQRVGPSSVSLPLDFASQTKHILVHKFVMYLRGKNFFLKHITLIIICQNSSLQSITIFYNWFSLMYSGIVSETATENKSIKLLAILKQVLPSLANEKPKGHLQL